MLKKRAYLTLVVIPILLFASCSQDAYMTKVYWPVASEDDYADMTVWEVWSAINRFIRENRSHPVSQNIVRLGMRDLVFVQMANYNDEQIALFREIFPDLPFVEFSQSESPIIHDLESLGTRWDDDMLWAADLINAFLRFNQEHPVAKNIDLLRGGDAI